MSEITVTEYDRERRAIWDEIMWAAVNDTLPAPESLQMQADRIVSITLLTQADARMWAAHLGFEDTGHAGPSGLWFHGRYLGWSWSIRSFEVFPPKPPAPITEDEAAALKARFLAAQSERPVVLTLDNAKAARP